MASLSQEELDAQGLAQERNDWVEFAGDHPYPSRDEITAAWSAVHLSSVAGGVAAWMALYDHDGCATMWNNLHDSDVMRRSGEAMHRAGGFEAMQANFYMITNFSGVRRRPMLYSYLRSSISSEWDGIGDWRA